MFRILMFVALGLMLTLTSGCSSVTLLRVKELKEVQNRVDSLSAALLSVQEQMLREQKQQSEMVRLMRADQQMYYDDLGRKISQLDGSLSESKYKLNVIDKKTDEVQKQLSEKMRADSTVVSVKNTQIEKLYQIAMSDFNAGRYDLSVSGFLDLINQFPESDQARNAAYWYAECYNAKKEYEKAEESYKNYIKKYPGGDKMCVCLYKLGTIYDKLQKTKSKEMVWQKLVETCPASQEASAVRESLKTGK